MSILPSAKRLRADLDAAHQYVRNAEEVIRSIKECNCPCVKHGGTEVREAGLIKANQVLQQAEDFLEEVSKPFHERWQMRGRRDKIAVMIADKKNKGETDSESEALLARIDADIAEQKADDEKFKWEQWEREHDRGLDGR